MSTNVPRTESEQTRTRFETVRAVFASYKMSCADLSRRLRDGVFPQNTLQRPVLFHTFRHTYATLLKGNGENVKVVQELMRHANISVTLNIYAQAITQTKRDAQSRVVSLLLDKNEEKPSTEDLSDRNGPTKFWRGFASC